MRSLSTDLHKALHPVRLFVCLTVLYLRFTRNQKAVETTNLADTWPRHG